MGCEARRRSIDAMKEGIALQLKLLLDSAGAQQRCVDCKTGGCIAQLPAAPASLAASQVIARTAAIDTLSSMGSGFPTYTRAGAMGEVGVSIVSRIVAEEFGWLFKRNHQLGRSHNFRRAFLCKTYACFCGALSGTGLCRWRPCESNRGKVWYRRTGTLPPVGFRYERSGWRRPCFVGLRPA